MSRQIRIEPGMHPGDLASLGMSVHKMLSGMPVVIKTRDGPGFLIDDGLIQETVHGGSALDRAFTGEKVTSVRADVGDYGGIPMYVSGITNGDGWTVAAIGVIDVAGTLGLKDFAEANAALGRQLGEGRRPVR